MKYELIDSDGQVPELLARLNASTILGVDTEFVSEDCFRPELCLLQISTRDSVFLVDPKGLATIEPIWQHLLDPKHLVVVHAGREETLFAYRATDRPFTRLFDVQVAVGMIGGEYPAAYGKVLQKVLHESVSKGETRTDWRHRPLTDSQLEYAALDVLHLPALCDELSNELMKLDRMQWLNDELEERQAALVQFERAEGWSRLPGVQTLTGSELGIARQLWLWRNERAIRKNMPARRVLRDDLIIELARRGSSDAKRIAHVRGLHHQGFQRFIPELAKAIALGLSSEPPLAPWNGVAKLPRPPALLQQFLSAAMGYLCRQNRISPAIVGTTEDVGQLASYWLAKLNLPETDLSYPNLLKGWRGELVGRPLFDVFNGKKTLRVVKPSNEMPLALIDLSNPMP